MWNMLEFFEQMSKIVKEWGGAVEGLQVAVVEFLFPGDWQAACCSVMACLTLANLQLVSASTENKSLALHLRR